MLKAREGSYLSGIKVTFNLKRFSLTQLPKKWVNYRNRKKPNPCFVRPCSQPGFTEPVPLDTAGALLPHLCTLTRMNGRYFSVALSSRSRALGVTQQVWVFGSPDFPQIQAESATASLTLL